jgi:uncharacterized protein (DUF1778 family)
MPEGKDMFSTLTIRLAAEDKTLLISMAEGYGMTMTEYIVSLVRRDSADATQTS